MNDMADQPLVSIISAYYNRQNYVVESVESLLKQTYRNLEIIIIDDGSSDATYEILCSLKDPRLKVFTQENRGFVGALRRGISLSHGPFIAIHDSGDLSFPERIEKQVAMLTGNPAIGLVGCYVERVNPVTGRTIFSRPRISVKASELLRYKNPITHGAVMYRREIYEQVGGYREFFKFAQDRDLWLRMSLVTDFGIVEQFLYRKYLLPDGVSVVPEKRILQRYLSYFARQCRDERAATGTDLVDRFGFQAAFLRKRSRGLANEFWIFAVQHILDGLWDHAWTLNTLSFREGWSVRSLLTFPVVWIGGHVRPLGRLMVVAWGIPRAMRRRWRKDSMFRTRSV